MDKQDNQGRVRTQLLYLYLAQVNNDVWLCCSRCARKNVLHDTDWYYNGSVLNFMTQHAIIDHGWMT